MKKHDVTISFTARRYNYVFVGLLCAGLAMFMAGLVIKAAAPQGYVGVAVVATLFCVVLVATASVSIYNCFFPHTIELRPDGLYLHKAGRTSQWKWQDYAGIWGWYALVIRMRTASGRIKSISIGLFWPINLEVEIYKYAKNQNLDVPIRFEAKDARGPGLFLIISCALVSIGIMVGAIGLLTL